MMSDVDEAIAQKRKQRDEQKWKLDMLKALEDETAELVAETAELVSKSSTAVRPGVEVIEVDASSKKKYKNAMSGFLVSLPSEELFVKNRAEAASKHTKSKQAPSHRSRKLTSEKVQRGGFKQTTERPLFI